MPKAIACEHDLNGCGACRQTRRKAYARAWQLNNPEKHRAAARAWATRNLEKHRANARAWQDKNQEKNSARQKIWEVKNRKNRSAQTLAWQRRNPEKVRAAKGMVFGDKTITQMLVTQMTCCAICRCTLLGGKATHVDHDHYTGAVRGLLCSRCNRGLGFFCDDPRLLARAIAYLSAAAREQDDSACIAETEAAE